MKKSELNELEEIYNLYKLTPEQKLNAVNLNGGFDFNLVSNPRFFKYAMTGHAFGYIGNSMRTKARDKEVERQMRLNGMGAGSIAEWLTSTSARHMMDEVEPNWTAEQFSEHIKSWVNEAPREIAIWSHPDHDGSFAGTLRVEAKLKEIFKK